MAVKFSDFSLENNASNITNIVGFTTGGEDNYQSIGYNFKFTNLQASLGLSQFNKIESFINNPMQTIGA